MTINKLNDYTAKIYLDEHDMEYFDINYANIDENNVKQLVLALSEKISEVIDLNLYNDKLYVEIFSRKSECIIFISCSSKSIIKRQISKKIICQFDDFDSLKNLCSYISINYPDSIKQSRLYCNHYYIRLIISVKNNYEKILKMSSGYGSIINGTEINTGATEEYFQCVLESDAVERVSMFIGK